MKFITDDNTKVNTKPGNRSSTFHQKCFKGQWPVRRGDVIHQTIKRFEAAKTWMVTEDLAVAAWCSCAATAIIRQMWGIKWCRDGMRIVVQPQSMWCLLYSTLSIPPLQVLMRMCKGCCSRSMNRYMYPGQFRTAGKCNFTRPLFQYSNSMWNWY